MSHRKLMSILHTLSPQARRQVIDFVAFLKKQQDVESRPTKPTRPDLSEQAFIGMWRDRDDLKNSGAWVRKMRQQEWSDA